MLDTKLKIKIDDGDAHEFIENMDKIIMGLVEKFQIDEILLIKIKNWFDHKWLNYSGKSVVQFHGGYLIETALQDEWREKITIPPFNPNRVLSETFYRIRQTNNKIFENSLHKTKSSNDNIHNRITNYSKNGLFVWYSSDTELNKTSSLMIYRVQNGFVETFYVSFENINGWKIKQAKNITPSELTTFMNQ
jgi:hypothetical protein